MTDKKVSQAEAKEQPGKGRRVLLIIAVVLLLGLNGVLLVVNNQQRADNEQLSADNASLTAEKESLLLQLDSLKLDVARLDSLGYLKDDQIADLNSQMAVLSRQLQTAKANAMDPSKIKAYKNQISSLQSQVTSLNAELDEAKKENSRLTQEKAELDSISQAQKLAMLELEEEKALLENKVELGSILKARSMSMVGLRVKGGREKETDRAKQVNQLKICYSLFPNNIAEKGRKEVYFKLKGADGKTMSDGQSKFTNANGKKDDFTIMQEINYTGGTEEFCAYWDNKGNAFESGGYLVEIFIDGSKTGSFDLNLR